MTRKTGIDERTLDTIEFIATLVFGLVSVACVFAFLAFVINGGCAG